MKKNIFTFTTYLINKFISLSFIIILKVTELFRKILKQQLRAMEETYFSVVIKSIIFNINFQFSFNKKDKVIIHTYTHTPYRKKSLKMDYMFHFEFPAISTLTPRYNGHTMMLKQVH